MTERNGDGKSGVSCRFKQEGIIPFLIIRFFAGSGVAAMEKWRVESQGDESLETLEPNDSVCQWNLKNSGLYFCVFLFIILR